jgi:adenylate cyclase
VEPPPQIPGGQLSTKSARASLRTAIVAFFFCFGLILTGPLAWYNYSRNSEAALEVAANTFEQAGTNVSLRTKLLVQPFNFLSGTVHLLPGADATPSGFSHPLKRGFQDILEDNPQIYSVYFGYGDGGFFQIVSLKDRPKVVSSLAAPAGTRFAVRSIELQGNARLERWQFLDENTRELAVSPPRPAGYDPRTRPWFKAASRMDGPQQTDLYVFSSTHELGLTVSRRIDGAGIKAPRPLVFGMDLTLESLSRFLAHEKIGASGLLFLFDADGGLVGYPDASRMTLAGKDKNGTQVRERASVDTLGDPLVKAVYGKFAEAGKVPLPQQPMRVDGVDYLFQVRPVAELGSDKEYMALVARVDDFTGPIKRTRNQSLLFALGIILVVVPLLGVAASRFSKGLRLLALEADRIRNMDLGSHGELHSHIDEMEQLGSAVTSMRSSLRSFSRYLPQTLVRQFIASGVDPELGGERREITLLFTDVENFTPLSEHLAPEDLMQAMGEYFEVIGQAILERGGTIDKFIGDAVMAFWNAPFESEDHVERACVAGLRLSKASEELNQRRQDSGLPLLRTRVGIHTGMAVVGNLGTSDRMDYTALGANVNLASRLEGLNKFYATRILVSRLVRERAKNNFLFRSVDVVVPKGATDPLVLFELVGAMPQSPFADVAAPRAKLGFCSRWERAMTLYRTAQWDKALVEFRALSEIMPDDHLATRYCTRTERLLQNKPGKDWIALQRYSVK